MEPRLQPDFAREPMPQAGGAVAESQNRVLRNTYWLLALSMLPTIAGAWVGMQLNFIALFAAAPIMTPLLMFGVMLGSDGMLHRSARFGIRGAGSPGGVTVC